MAPVPATEADNPTTALARITRNQDRLRVQRRRDLVFQWRVREGLRLSDIVDRLAKENPPIYAGISDVSRDAQIVQRELRKSYERGRFDPGLVLAKALDEINEIAEKARQDAADCKDYSKRAQLYRVRLDAVDKRIEILQSSGLMTKELGRMLLTVADGKQVERVPGGEELQKLFDSVNVVEGELVSEAELAWKYGDAAASDAAASEAERAG